MGAVSFSLDPELLRFFRSGTGASCFVETGTFTGDTLAMALPSFERCFSVEKSPAYFEQAVRRFVDQSNVEITLGDSPAFLASLREECLARPTLFWLDAHWCAAENTAGAQSQSPLLDELRSIGSLHAASTILIDDARLYLSPPSKPHRAGDWPEFHDIVTQLFATSADHRLMVFNDVIVFYPAFMREAVFEFASEHGVDWLAVMGDARIYRSLAHRRGFRMWKRLARRQ